MMRLESNELRFVRVNAQAILQQPISDDIEAIRALLKYGLVVGASSDNSAVINIGGQEFEAPGLPQLPFDVGEVSNCNALMQLADMMNTSRS